jgi:hypothetical protein
MFMSAAAPNKAEVNEADYLLVSDSSKGTITMYLGSRGKSCSATFKLLAGYAFDLSPPAGATCSSNAATSTMDGRTFCKLCPAGSYKSAKGVCEECPTGTFQNRIGATACKVCPAGTSCDYYSGHTDAYPCAPGSYNAKRGSSAACALCPKNTFAAGGATKCAMCPRFTKSARGSGACGVYW